MTKTRKTTHTPCSGKDDPRPVAASALPMCLAYGKQILPDRSGNVISLSSRAPQVEYLLTVLNSPEHRNAILVGRPGVGKTTLLRELAALIEDGSAGEELGGAVIIEIDMNRLKGGSGISGAMEKIAHTLWKEAEMYAGGRVVFFMDEAHKLSSGGADSIGNILKPLVTGGRVPVILATTDDEYRMYIEQDGALKRRFEEIYVREPDGDSMMELLSGKSAVYGRELKVSVPEEVLRYVLHLGKKYFPEMAEPARSLRLLERTCTIARLRKKGGAVLKADADRAVSRMKNLDLCGAQKAGPGLGERIVGQEAARKRMEDFLNCEKAGFSNDGRPKGFFLLMGPSGCGKSLVAAETAKSLGVQDSGIVRLTLTPDITARDLKGHSPVQPGMLTEPVRKNPRSVIVLDGLEKAREEVCVLLKEIASSGKAMNYAGMSVDFRDAVLFITASCEDASLRPAKAIGFGTEAAGSPDGVTHGGIRALAKELFYGQFASASGVFVPFSPLSREDLKEIFRREHEQRLVRQARELGYALAVTGEVLEHVLDEAIAAGGNGWALSCAADGLYPVLAEADVSAAKGAGLTLAVNGGKIEAVPGPSKEPAMSS